MSAETLVPWGSAHPVALPQQMLARVKAAIDEGREVSIRYAGDRARTYEDAQLMERAYIDGWNAHVRWLKKRQPSTSRGEP